jgi:hypothetical protein
MATLTAKVARPHAQVVLPPLLALGLEPPGRRPRGRRPAQGEPNSVAMFSTWAPEWQRWLPNRQHRDVTQDRLTADALDSSKQFDHLDLLCCPCETIASAPQRNRQRAERLRRSTNSPVRRRLFCLLTHKRRSKTFQTRHATTITATARLPRWAALAMCCLDGAPGLQLLGLPRTPIATRTPQARASTFLRLGHERPRAC